MKSISNYINIEKNKYKIVSVGLPPSITQINGFYTLDGDFDILPGNYFLEFRKIIEPELKQNKKIEINYDYGGNQLFIYAAAKRFAYFNNAELILDDLTAL